MWKGSSLTRITAGLIMVAATAACGGDAPDTGASDTAAPATQTETAAPATGDPTTAPAAGAGDAAAPAAGGSSADLVAQGQQLYQSSICVSCHGPTANGTPLAPALNDGTWLWIEDGQDLQTQIATIIRTGVSQPKEYPAPMLPFGGAGQMSDEDVEAMSAYIVSLNQ